MSTSILSAVFQPDKLRRSLGSAVVFLGFLFLTGCSTAHIHRLTQETLPRKSDEESVKLFINKVQEPNREIAFIDSRSYADRSEKSQEKQLRQIRHAARKLGADAVHDIRPMTMHAQGVMIDEAVPFEAIKQGRYNLYFLRGTAIVYTNEPSPLLAPASQETTGPSGKPVPEDPLPLLPPPPSKTP